MSGFSAGAATTVTLATHQGNRSTAVNHRYSMPPGHDGRNGGGPQPGAPPLPHIDDLLAVPRDIDPNTSIKRLLEMAETSLRQAATSRDFNRPAQALQDFLWASIIAIQLIGSHKDYPSLKDSSGSLGKSYSALLKKISQQNDGYMRIKQDIIADNKRTGVQPTVRRPVSRQGNTAIPVSSSSLQSPILSQDRSKTKPTVHPKPSTMLGNTVKPGHGRTSSLGNSSQDSLLHRFTTLSGPQPVPGQDPRIRTHTIVAPGTMPPPPPPRGPRAMPPPPQKNKIVLNSAIPPLPKMPDAIYSPARGSISGESTRPPPSTPRATYSRTGSSTSLNSLAAASQQQQKNDYFASTQGVQTMVKESPSALPSGLPTKLAAATAMTVDDLRQLMQAKCSVLIIDVRSREDFVQGHIWSASTICIEPTILNRGDMSATEICESLVLSADKEKAAFENRHKYDFVVFHDQDAEEVPEYPKTVTDQALTRLQRALVDFSYDASRLKNPPKLLKGGIDAWVDLMGPASLQSGTNSVMAARQPKRPSEDPRQRQRPSFRVKSLSRNEIEEWQAIVKNDDLNTASAPGYVRSQEDFLRRFPPVLPEQESMTGWNTTDASSRASTIARSPVDNALKYGSSSIADLNTDLPAPPARPAPAVPRPSYSGISQAANDDNTYDDTGAPQVPKLPGRTKTGDQFPAETPQIPTGLVNPHNWCYANSTLQALLASPGFGRELAESTWKAYSKVPRKKDEKIENPQLMMKMMSNLFHWMSTCKFESMQAQTLMDYCRHLRRPGEKGGDNPRAVFGSNQQQDASEFQDFLFQVMDDETNVRRDVEMKKSQDPEGKGKVLTYDEAANEYWPSYRAENLSILDRYWRGHELQTTRCNTCQTPSYTFSAFNYLLLSLPHTESASMTLSEVMGRWAAKEQLDDYTCVTCKQAREAIMFNRFVSMPQLLCVALRRDGWGTKLFQVVTWDLDDFDFTPWVAATPGWTGQDQMYNASVKGPFHYECYAVVVHQGTSMTSGHYYAYIRKSSSRQSSIWYRFNDTIVTKVNNIYDEMNRLRGDATPFLLYFRRKS